MSRYSSTSNISKMVQDGESYAYNGKLIRAVPEIILGGRQCFFDFSSPMTCGKAQTPTSRINRNTSFTPTTLEYPRPSGQTWRYYVSTLRCRSPPPEDNFWNSPKKSYMIDIWCSDLEWHLTQISRTRHYSTCACGLSNFAIANDLEWPLKVISSTVNGLK